MKQSQEKEPSIIPVRELIRKERHQVKQTLKQLTKWQVSQLEGRLS